jgi:plastocyanin
MKKMLAVTLISIVLLAGCGGSDDGEPRGEATQTPAPTVTPCSDASEIGGQADLEMRDYSFDPQCLQISRAQGLRIHNEGDTKHNLSVENIAGINIDVKAGEEKNTEPTGLTEGRYTIFCRFHRKSNGMEGVLRVVPK